jgi:glycosyltransferase involved in cell wall biosynthesis
VREPFLKSLGERDQPGAAGRTIPAGVTSGGAARVNSHAARKAGETVGSGADLGQIASASDREDLATVEGRERSQALELTVVIPCLNEVDTLATCLGKAQTVISEHAIDAEIVVADNGSTDGSREIAADMGARVVDVDERGYGHALMTGIRAAKGRYVVMADADDSYDLLELPKFVEKLRDGYDLVQGCRLERGGGQVMPGAMPLLHRRWGNPMFSRMARLWFGAQVTDVYCGFRGFTKEFWLGLGQSAGGMEFATEMIIKASLRGANIAEVPITLHPDGRVSHKPHLRTFRDGWRTLRFYLMYSPRWLFLLPGAALVTVGLVLYALALPKLQILGATLDAHTLMFASLGILCGYQAILFAILTKTYTMAEGLVPEDPRWMRFFEVVNLERGLILALGALLAGVVLLGLAVNDWRVADFGRLDYGRTMRLTIPGATLTALGFQTVLSSFFVSILGMRGK